MTAPAGVAAVLLAAGSSRRFGPANKLLAEAAGVPLALVVARALRASRATELIVVTGHEANRIEALLAGLGCRFLHNPRHVDGIATSIATAARNAGPHHQGLLIAQADMPALTSALIDRLIDRFIATGSSRIVHPVAPDGLQRNPVIWPQRLLPELAGLTGDLGAKALIARHGASVETVAVDDAGQFVDLDTEAELVRFNEALRQPKG